MAIDKIHSGEAKKPFLTIAQRSFPLKRHFLMAK